MNDPNSIPEVSTWLQRLRRRHVFVVNKPLQSRLLMSSFRHIVIVVFVLGGGLFLPSVLDLTSNDLTSDTAVRAAERLLFLHSHFWTAAVLAVLLIALDSVRLSHRIAGPLYRFDLALSEIRRGKIPEVIQLRNGDLLQGMCGRINDTLAHVQSQHDQATESQNDLRQAIEEARSLCQTGATTVPTEALSKLITHAETVVGLSEGSAPFEVDDSTVPTDLAA